MSVPSAGRTGRAVSLTGGLLFVVSLLYALLRYVSAFGVSAGPWTGPAGAHAIAVDAGLFAAFAFHHSVFARDRVKAVVARLVTGAMERSAYVWIASLLFLANVLFWVPVPGIAWRAPVVVAPFCYAVQIAGVLLTGYASQQLGVLDLAGIRQAFGHERPPREGLTVGGAYRLVRHPIYFAWLLMVWPSPVMTGSRLLFAIMTTLYLAIAVPFEEHSLRRVFGDAYTAYTRRVRWRMLPGVY
ncbi:MAG: isoprenylcysteine carboxylmethyltransferase family protein [Vicinamibacterales bacterium]